ncbi:MAG: hypothetical protein DDG60_12015 [Anaerolineae bacterium]|nr:MAG: hypothetical protein DDG60_12015 [Anaerolineae bacterium]
MSTPENATPLSTHMTHLRQVNVQVITLINMLGAWLLLIGYVAGYAITREARLLNLIAMQAIYGFAITIAWGMRKRGQGQGAIWLLLLSNFAASIFLVHEIEWVAIFFGILLPIISSMVAWQTLPKRSALGAILVSILSGILIVTTDLNFGAPNRLSGGFFLTSLLIVAGGTAIFILILNGLRGTEFKSISTQLRVAFLLTSILPVLIVAIFQTLILANVLTTQATNTLLQNSNAFTETLESQLFSIINSVEEDASNPAIRNYLQKPDGNTAFLTLLASRYPDLISYGLLNKDGFLVVDNRGNTRGNERDTTYFQNTISTRITYISDVVLDENTQRGVFFVSKAVLDEQGNLLGVLRIKISAERLQTIAEESAAQFGPGFSVIILDDANIILAHSADPDLRTKTLSVPNRNVLNALQQAGRLPLAGQLNAELDSLEKALAKATLKTVFTGFVLPGETTRNYITVTSIAYKPWKALIAQQTAVFLAPAINQTLSTSLIILILLAAVYFGANLTANLLVEPIQTLTAAAQELGKGKLNAPLVLPRKDELGTLANVLENTRQQIYELLETLEQRVEQRTSELMQANERNERRAQQLTLASMIAHAVASVQDVNELLQQITQQISEAFGYYHVGIFLLDESGEYAVLRAANSQGGQAMLARGHRLRVGRQGIVGTVTNTGRYRIALDVGEDAVFFNNPDLPNTRSEAALPLIVGETIIGALDVQSTEPNAFSQDDIVVLSLLSDQISVAIQNARLFEQIRKDLSEMQRIYVETSQLGWRALVRESSTSGYRYTKGSIEPLRKIAEDEEKAATPTLEVPIVVRGEKLGALKLRRPVPWTEAETRMYQAIAERMSFALDNARLYSEARRRANLERVIADTATKISSSVRVETILRIAAEEISNLLDGSEVLVQLQPEAITRSESKITE